jgi:hypothetical protein
MNGMLQLEAWAVARSHYRYKCVPNWAQKRRVSLQFKDTGLQICSGFSLHLQCVHFRNAVVDPCD